METKKQKEIKPSVFIAMPCYDSVKINTMLSIFQADSTYGHQVRHGSGNQYDEVSADTSSPETI